MTTTCGAPLDSNKLLLIAFNMLRKENINSVLADFRFFKKIHFLRRSFLIRESLKSKKNRGAKCVMF